MDLNIDGNSDDERMEDVPERWVVSAWSIAVQYGIHHDAHSWPQDSS